ncbi:MAG: Signal peptide peptidase SppA [Parcubacteria group bacterium GW2011_GWA2_45_15]|nr:MAG: Signal peptide peptidase SppA [Parcubacteria group bacterium GW2011_GWC1_42_21]KKT96864.1 MAG: Signal peptide peptidase SppA [Parcubacteria group bacterium GW2011_GWA2_45_15]
MLEGSVSKKKAVVLLVIVGVVALVAGTFIVSETNYYEDNYSLEDSCNVLALSANGILSTYIPEQTTDDWSDVSSSEYITDGILSAQDDPDIKAVLLSIDSSGGYGVAGEEIANALKRLDKPSVAVIRTVGASAAYWAATGADKIYASKMSDVGSIAITASYLDETNKIAKEGYQYTELSSGKYKDLGDTGRPLTVEERAIVLSDLRKAHEVFVQDVATNRNLELGEVEKLANGLTYVGTDALSYGLIDEIGDIASATKYLEEQIGEKVELCWY